MNGARSVVNNKKKYLVAGLLLIKKKFSVVATAKLICFNVEVACSRSPIIYFSPLHFALSIRVKNRVQDEEKGKSSTIFGRKELILLFTHHPIPRCYWWEKAGRAKPVCDPSSLPITLLVTLADLEQQVYSDLLRLAINLVLFSIFFPVDVEHSHVRFLGNFGLLLWFTATNSIP